MHEPPGRLQPGRGGRGCAQGRSGAREDRRAPEGGAYNPGQEGWDRTQY